MGEVLPMVYMLHTASKNEQNYTFDPAVYKDLSKETAKYVRDQMKAWLSIIVICPMGFTDTPFWYDILKYYIGEIAPVPVHEGLSIPEQFLVPTHLTQSTPKCKYPQPFSTILVALCYWAPNTFPN